VAWITYEQSTVPRGVERDQVRAEEEDGEMAVTGVDVCSVSMNLSGLC
jgi:hypothetical protein